MSPKEVLKPPRGWDQQGRGIGCGSPGSMPQGGSRCRARLRCGRWWMCGNCAPWDQHVGKAKQNKTGAVRAAAGEDECGSVTPVSQGHTL